MNIAIDISPLESGHKVRGVGFYLKHLKESLEKYFPEHTYSFFTDKNNIDSTFEVVHYPYFDSFQKTLPFSSQYKTVVTVHDLTPLVFPKLFPVGLRGKLNWEIQKRALQRVDAIITDSRASKNDVITLTGVKEKLVTPVYLAAGEEFREIKMTEKEREALRKKYTLPKKFVLYVGDVTPNKNLPRLLEAIKKTDIPLVMVGKALSETDYDTSHPWNQDLVRVHSLSKNNTSIHILGFVSSEDLVRLYNIATVFIMPSLYEGFGLPVLEAMSCGCPVITTKEGSLSEVAGESAYFIDAMSTESMAGGIKKVYEDEALQKNLSKNGLTHAKNFSWKKAAEETLKVYEKVLGS